MRAVEVKLREENDFMHGRILWHATATINGRTAVGTSTDPGAACVILFRFLQKEGVL